MATTPIQSSPGFVAAPESEETQRRIHLMLVDVRHVANVLFAELVDKQRGEEIRVLKFGGADYGPMQQREGSIDVGGAFRADIRFLLQDNGRIHQLQIAIPYVVNRGRSRYGHSPMRTIGETMTPPSECEPSQTWESLAMTVGTFVKEVRNRKLSRFGVMARTSDVGATLERFQRSDRGRIWAARINGFILRYPSLHVPPSELQVQSAAAAQAPILSVVPVGRVI